MPNRTRFIAPTAPPRTRITTRYEVEWLDPTTGKVRDLVVTHHAGYFHHVDHVEIEGEPQGRGRNRTLKPHPLSPDTGYLSLFVDPNEIEKRGGAVAYVMELTAEAIRAARRARQNTTGDLFAWADARHAATVRKAPKRARTAVAKKSRPSRRGPS